MITRGEIAYYVRNKLDEVLLAIVCTVYNGNIYNRSCFFLKVYTVEAWYPCACGGKDKLNHIVEVSILFPYLIVNTVFLCQKKINVSELEFIINAKYPEKNKGIRQSRSRSMGQDQLFDQLRLINFLQSCSG